MLTGIDATIHHGHTGCDHLIDAADITATTNAVAGQEFRTAKDALAAAKKAFLESCDERVEGARITVRLRNAHGDEVGVG